MSESKTSIQATAAELPHGRQVGRFYAQVTKPLIMLLAQERHFISERHLLVVATTRKRQVNAPHVVLFVIVLKVPFPFSSQCSSEQ